MKTKKKKIKKLLKNKKNEILNKLYLASQSTEGSVAPLPPYGTPPSCACCVNVD